MSIHAWTFVVAAALAGMTVCGIAAPRLVPFSSKVPASEGRSVMPARDVPIDFRGNEVRPAVARYTVDAMGALYEEHSPETEVQRLAPPKG